MESGLLPMLQLRVRVELTKEYQGPLESLSIMIILSSNPNPKDIISI